MTTEGKWLHSRDRDHFGDTEEYDSPEAAREGAVHYYSLKHGDMFYIGQIGAKGTLPEIDASDIIDQMHCNLSDNFGDCADDALDVSKAEEDDLGVMLNQALHAWVAKHDIKVTCFTVDDIEAYIALDAGGSEKK